MSESSPSITFMLQYTEANSGFVDYTNRDEAVEVDNELNLETHRQNIESLTEDEIQKIQAEVPETKLNFQEYIDYMNRSYATENQNEEMTAIFTKEANYLQRSKVTELKRLIKMALFYGRVLSLLIMIFWPRRDYMIWKLGKLISKLSSRSYVKHCRG